MNSTFLKVLFLLLVLVAGAAFFLLFPASPEQVTVRVAPSGTKTYWSDQIRTTDPGVVYQELKRTFSGAKKDIQHNAAHIFGESLYEVLGVPGITTCDSDFRSGCYHGFLTRAVQVHGTFIVRELDGFCRASLHPLACQHGLGHGVLEFYGRARLTQALDACADLSVVLNPVQGCYSGVFMEYNEPEIQNETLRMVVQRPLGAEERPYAPCPDVDSKYRPACYQQLAQWWSQLFHNDFTHMGALCTGITDGQNRETCFSGIGPVAASTAGYDQKKTAITCMKMPEDARDTCLKNAAWSFSANIGDRSGGERLCKQVSLGERQQCLENL
jgi:hypothetical protein